ncbi:MAG TPA: SDR family oxidoreductase [Bryobacteraceae bacterium]|jgi:3-oxoacyl-[acyl-carrier protein] reductase
MSATRNPLAIVTGASRGIGRAIALRLARDGATTLLTARDRQALDSVAHEIQSAGGRALVLALDLRDPSAAGRLVEFAIESTSRIDILVNNAGATKRGDFLALSDNDWADGFALKFFGAVRLTRAAWPHLKAHAGSVVQISGIGGRTPGLEFTIGGSVNAALLSFTKAIADLGIADGVQVNAISPGAVRTDRLRIRLTRIAQEQQVNLAEAERRFTKESGIARVGEPEDIAELVAYLVSPQGRFLQGSLIDIDGGQTKTI